MAMRRNRTGDILVALTVGIGVGAVMGLLLAPQSGEETIDYLRKGASEKFDTAVKAGRGFARRAQDGVGQARDYVNDAVDNGRGQVSRMQDRISDRVEQFRDDAAGAVDAGQRAYREASNS
jgi:gas vesicle protein